MTEKIKAEIEKTIDEIGQYVSEFNYRQVLLPAPSIRNILTDLVEEATQEDKEKIHFLEDQVQDLNNRILGLEGE